MFAFIESGIPAVREGLPKKMHPAELVYDVLGRHMRPGFKPANREEMVASLFTSLPPTKAPKPGKKSQPVRVGLGNACLVFRDRALLLADVHLPQPAEDWDTGHRDTGHIEVRGGDVMTGNSLMVELLLEPPSEPFLFIMFGKRTDILPSLRMTVSPDYLEICGDKARVVRRKPVIDGLTCLGDAPRQAWKIASAMHERRLRDPSQNAKVEETFAKMAKTNPLVQRAIDLGVAGPLYGSVEWDAINSVLISREKRAAAEK